MELEPESPSGADTLISRYMSEGETLFQDGEYEEALSRWLKVLEIDPANEVAMQNMAKAHEMLMGSPFKKVVSRGPAPSDAPSSPFETQKMDAAKVAQKLSSTRDTDRVPREEVVTGGGEEPASEPLSGPISQDSGPISRKPESERLEPHLKRYLKRGVDSFNSKDFEKAIAEWAKVLRERPLHGTTLQYIRKARKRLDRKATPEKRAEETEAYERLFLHGKEYFAEGEHRMAINQFVQALTFRPEDKDLQDWVRKAEASLKESGESQHTAPGRPRTLRHGDSPLASTQSGAYVRPTVDRESTSPKEPQEPKEPKEGEEKLRAAAENIYTQILKDEATGGVPRSGAVARPTGIRTQAVSSKRESSTLRKIEIAIVLVGLIFIGVSVVRTYLKPDTEHLDRAILLADAKQWANARAEFGQHIFKNPEDPRGYRGRAEASRELGQIGETLEDLKKLLELEPTDFQNIVDYGAALLSVNRYEEARDAFQVALTKSLSEEQRATSLDSLLTCLINLGELDAAIETCDELLKLNPDPEIAQIKGELLLSLNRFEEGRQALIDVLAQGRRSDSIVLALYRSYLLEGKEELAQGVLEQNPFEEDALAATFLRARLAYRTGDLQQSLQLIEQGLEQDPAHWRGYAELATVWTHEWMRTSEDAMAGRVRSALDAARERSRIDGRLSFALGIALRILGDRRYDLNLEQAERHLSETVLDDSGVQLPGHDSARSK